MLRQNQFYSIGPCPAACDDVKPVLEQLDGRVGTDGDGNLAFLGPLKYPDHLTQYKITEFFIMIVTKLGDRKLVRSVDFDRSPQIENFLATPQFRCLQEIGIFWTAL